MVVGYKVKNISLISAIFVTFIHLRDYLLCGRISSVWWWVFPGPVLETAVPFFFISAGYWLSKHLDEHDWWIMAIKKRFFTLLVPFAVMNLSAYVICADSYSILGVVKALGLIRTTSGSGGGSAYPFLPQLWFVMRLYLLILVLPLVSFLIKRGLVWALGICVLIYCSAFLRTCYCEGALNVFWIDVFRYVFPPRGLAEVCLGVSIGRYGLPRLNRRTGVVILFTAYCILATRYYALSKIFGVAMQYVGIPAFVYGLWIVVPGRRFLPWLSENTFGIYLFHYSFLIGIYHILVYFDLLDFAHSIVFGSIIVFVSVICSAGTSKLIKKNRLLHQVILGSR